MMTHTWKEVCRVEFDAFIAAYPRILEKDFTSICEPPMISYNDFSDGKKWPESMVAKIILFTRHPIFKGQQNEYFVLSN